VRSTQVGPVPVPIAEAGDMQAIKDFARASRAWAGDDKYVERLGRERAEQDAEEASRLTPDASRTSN
jgi:hypothetical protein